MLHYIKVWLAKKLLNMFTVYDGKEQNPAPPIKNFSFTTTSSVEGEDTQDALDVNLQAIHKKLRENPVSKLTIGELSTIMEKDLNLPPVLSTYFTLNRSMVEITVLEFTSMNVVLNKSADKVDKIEFTFVDSVNATGSKLILPAEAVSELLVPVIFKKVETHANRS
jgi:hypothetical protein